MHVPIAQNLRQKAFLISQYRHLRGLPYGQIQRDREALVLLGGQVIGLEDRQVF